MARFNPNNEQDVVRLRQALAFSGKKLEPFRVCYLEDLKAYVGHRYGESGHSDKEPFNMVRLAVDTYARQLAARNPRVLALTFDAKLKGSAAELETAVNYLLGEINLGLTVRAAVKQAMFAMGVIKVGLTLPGDSRPFANFLEAGQPFAENVLFEDWVHDMTARNLEECDYMGHKYRVDYDSLMESDVYTEAAKKGVMRRSGNAGAVVDNYASSQLSAGQSSMVEEYRDHADLWDIWLPRDKLIVTLPADSSGPPLRVVEWEGPERGPFHILSFCDVPGNVMAASPVSMWRDANSLLNRLIVKLGRQAERQKSFTVVSGAARTDGTAQRIIDVPDGNVLGSDDASSVKEVNLGGIHGPNMSFALQIKELLSYMAGNLDSMAGLGQQADTLGQEKIIKASNSQLIQDYSEKVVEFTTGIVSDLGYYLYSDPVSDVPLEMSIPGVDQEIPFIWTAEDRKEAYVKFRLRLEPFSMAGKSPSTRVNTILTILGALQPYQQQMAEQGVSVDVERLAEILSKLSDSPELQEIFRVGEVNLGQLGQQVPSQSPMGAPTANKPNGSYVRTNVSGGNPAAQADKAIQSFMKAGQGSRE